eukprot:NODE_404_length_8016_cov_1.092965.p2 type:complete len:668 gc:universal NODE_404_length_8016_cov_1.092965:1635-3638(+)
MDLTISTIFNTIPNSCKIYINPCNIDKLDINFNSCCFIDDIPCHIWPSYKIKPNEIGVGSVLLKSMSKGVGSSVIVSKKAEFIIIEAVYIDEKFEKMILDCFKDHLQTLKFVDPKLDIHFKALGKWHKTQIIKTYPNFKNNCPIQIGKNLKVYSVSNSTDSIPFGGYDILKKQIKDASTDAVRKNKFTGICIHGKPGVGKSLLCQHVACDLGLKYYTINGTAIISSYQGETENQIKLVFEMAKQAKPSVIILDNMESICGNRLDLDSNINSKITNSLLSLIDGEQNLDGIILLGTCTSLDKIDAAFKRSGRFEIDYEMDVPDWQDRFKIYEAICEGYNLQIEMSQAEGILKLCHGYVGADISAMLKYALFYSLERSSDVIELQDLMKAKSIIKPSALKDVQLTIPNVRWEDIGGQDETKAAIKSAVELPFRRPDLFLKHNLNPPTGILLYGPPGTGKTLLAKAIATESRLNFLSVKGPELFQKYVGESEKALKAIFDKARTVAPVVIFFDEIDSIGKSRGLDSSLNDRMLVQFLTEMDAIQHANKVTVVAATNRPDILDAALIRPGRFDRLIYIAPPDKSARISIFKINLKGMPISEIDFEKLANISEGCTGAEIKAICQEAAFHAIENDLDQISNELLIETCLNNPTRLNSNTLRYYQQFMNAHNN